MFNYTSIDGCDSIVSLNLKLKSGDFVIDYRNICEGDTLFYRGISYF